MIGRQLYVIFIKLNYTSTLLLDINNNNNIMVNLIYTIYVDINTTSRTLHNCEHLKSYKTHHIQKKLNNMCN